MAQIFFYHLTLSTLEEMLPLLLERCMERGWKALVHTEILERRNILDQYLWVYRDDSFLPHGIDAEETAALQPILLTTSMKNYNQAEALFVLDGSFSSDSFSYERIIFIFDDYDEEQKNSAKRSWKYFKERNYDLSLWQQNKNRKWEQKM